MKELKHLDPLELLEFLKGVQTKKNITIACEITTIEKDWVGVNPNINGYNFSFFVPSDWYQQIGSVYFYETSPVALAHLAFLIFERMPDYLENVYFEWVKNDTGYSVSNEFALELLEEIERIQNFLKIES